VLHACAARARFDGEPASHGGRSARIGRSTDVRRQAARQRRGRVSTDNACGGTTRAAALVAGSGLQASWSVALRPSPFALRPSPVSRQPSAVGPSRPSPSTSSPRSAQLPHGGALAIASAICSGVRSRW
jgi:hypothetical protein